MNPDTRPDWILYAPAPEGLPVPERAKWIEELCASRERLGDENQYVLLPEVECGNWQCGWSEGYVTRNTVVGAFFSCGKCILALLEAGSTAVLAHPRLVGGECVGAYMVPMSGEPKSRADLAQVFSLAYVHLKERGLLGPHGDEGLYEAGA